MNQVSLIFYISAESNQRHSVSDISYKGNAHDIRHLLDDKVNGYKIVQHEISLRDINLNYKRRKKIKEFDLTPFKIDRGNFNKNMYNFWFRLFNLSSC